MDSLFYMVLSSLSITKTASKPVEVKKSNSNQTSSDLEAKLGFGRKFVMTPEYMNTTNTLNINKGIYVILI